MSYTEEQAEYYQECEVCNSWFDERDMKVVNAERWTGEWQLANNAGGDDIMVCVTCDGRLSGRKF